MARKLFELASFVRIKMSFQQNTYYKLNDWIGSPLSCEYYSFSKMCMYWQKIKYVTIYKDSTTYKTRQFK